MSKKAANSSFTRNLYDSFDVEKRNKDGMYSYNYITDSVNESNDGNKYNSYLRKARNIPSTDIDEESDLRKPQDTRDLSNWNTFQKKRNCKGCKKCEKGLPCNCESCSKMKAAAAEVTTRDFMPEYTRLQKPCNIYSGININRFYPLYEDAQDSNNIQSNSYIGTNTRLQIKDAFRKESSVDFKL